MKPATLLAIVITVLSCYLALRDVNPAEVGSALQAAQPAWVSLALLSVALNTVAKAARWKILLADAGRAIPLRRYLAVLLAGQTLNTIYPARVGDLARAYAIGGLGPGRSFTLGTVVAEKLVDTFCYGLLFVWLLLAMQFETLPLPAWLGDSVWGGLVFSLLICIAGAVAVWQHQRVGALLEVVLRRLPIRWQQSMGSRIHAGLAGLAAIPGRSGLAGLVGWSAVVWGAALINNHLILLSLGQALPWTASALVLVALQAGISLPGAPGRVGLWEYLCILSLAVFGVRQATALGFAVLLHAVVMIPSTLIGLGFVWLLGIPRRPGDAA